MSPLIPDDPTFPNQLFPNTEQVMTVELRQGGSGGFTPSFTNVTWVNGPTPTLNTQAGKADLLQIRWANGYYGAVVVGTGFMPPAAPAAPASITVTPGGAQNTVTAAAVTANPAVTGYTIERGTTAGGESTTPIATNVSLPYVDTGLTVGQTYYYKVAAVNAVGTGPYSAEGSGTPVAPGSLPGAPTGLTLTPGDGLMTVNASAVSASPAVTGYTVYRGTSSGGEAAVATNVALPYADTGLTNGTTYFYKLAAVNSVGTGAQSAEASAAPVGAHYATFSAQDQAIYTTPNAAFNPGSNPFDMRAQVRQSAWGASANGAADAMLIGCWDVTVANRLWALSITTAGLIQARWATGASASASAVSSVAIGAATGTTLWVRAAVTPTTGSVTFYTSTDGATWTQLGSVVTATGSGAVYTPSTLPYLVIGSVASASSGAGQEMFLGRFYQGSLAINGTVITNPTAGASGTTDTHGYTYGTSSGVVYS